MDPRGCWMTAGSVLGAFPKGPKYHNIGNAGFLYREPKLWFWVDTLCLGTWKFRASLQIFLGTVFQRSPLRPRVRGTGLMAGVVIQSLRPIKWSWSAHSHPEVDRIWSLKVPTYAFYSP